MIDDKFITITLLPLPNNLKFKCPPVQGLFQESWLMRMTTRMINLLLLHYYHHVVHQII